MVLRILLLSSVFFFVSCYVPERDNPLDPDGVNYTGAKPTNSSSSVAVEVVYGDPVEYGEIYETVVIGEQTWFKRNLNYEVEGSKCYGDNEANCVTYGRLYDWATAMALDPSCNTSACASEINAKHQGVCPNGWHIPSDADWNALMKFVNPSCSDNSNCNYAGNKLRSSNGWENNSTGTDNYGFSALSGGSGNSNGGFEKGNRGGYWWSTSENIERIDVVYIRYMDDDVANTVVWSDVTKKNLYSVRCLQD